MLSLDSIILPIFIFRIISDCMYSSAICLFPLKYSICESSNVVKYTYRYIERYVNNE